MFQSSKERLLTWLSRFDDILGEHPDETRRLDERPGTGHERPAHHPHRRPLRWERDRRPGSVPARPAYCITPLRAAPGAVPRQAHTTH